MGWQQRRRQSGNIAQPSERTPCPVHAHAYRTHFIFSLPIFRRLPLKRGFYYFNPYQYSNRISKTFISEATRPRVSSHTHCVDLDMYIVLVCACMYMHDMYLYPPDITIHGTTWSPHPLQIVARASIREELEFFQTVVARGLLFKRGFIGEELLIE